VWLLPLYHIWCYFSFLFVTYQLYHNIPLHEHITKILIEANPAYRHVYGDKLDLL